jgi:hypothetical protein
VSLFLSSSFVVPFLSVSSSPLGFNFANTQITTRHGCAFRLRKVHEFTWGLLLQKRTFDPESPYFQGAHAPVPVGCFDSENTKHPVLSWQSTPGKVERPRQFNFARALPILTTFYRPIHERLKGASHPRLIPRHGRQNPGVSSKQTRHFGTAQDLGPYLRLLWPKNRE